MGDWRDGNYPTVGADVVLFCGAALLGDVTIGDRVTIGANSVVLDTVPPDCVAVGAPARVKQKGAAAVLAKLA